VKYSLATSGILDGWRYYPPEIFPPLWSRVDHLIDSGDLRASDEVLRELKKKEGDERTNGARLARRYFCLLMATSNAPSRQSSRPIRGSSNRAAGEALRMRS
jgi:hypothetical protein